MQLHSVDADEGDRRPTGWSQYPPSLLRAALWNGLSAWSGYEAYGEARYPSLNTGWNYFLLAVALTSLWGTFESYRAALRPQIFDGRAEIGERSDRNHQVVLRTAGLQMILFGMVFFGGATLTVLDEWNAAHWPSVDAVVGSREFHTDGPAVEFVYQVEGKSFTARATGSRRALIQVQAYSPGTMHRIRYNPHDPRRIATEWNGWATRRSDGLLLLGSLFGVVLLSEGFKILREPRRMSP